MKIRIITPAPPHSRKGNRVTAVRYARLLRDLGHHVAIAEDYNGSPCDLMIALHARKSFPAMERLREKQPNTPTVLVLTGTDLYGDIHSDPSARRALEWAWRLVVLQPMGIAALPARLRSKARAIVQSAQASAVRPPPLVRSFEVCVLGHLRPVKDPLRAAKAARLLPPSSRVSILHIGAALTKDMETAAQNETNANPRYRWVGAVPRWKALRYLARSRLMVLTSRLEGGANVISEAIAASVPVLSSRIAGSIGVLGADYAGYFPVGDTRSLASLLLRAETDIRFYRGLLRWCRRLAPLVDPAHERRGWAKLLSEPFELGRQAVE